MSISLLAGLSAGSLLVLSGFLAWQLRRTRTQLRTIRRRTPPVEQTYPFRKGLFQIVDDALLVLDTKHRILFSNPTAEVLLGCTLTGKRLLKIIPQKELATLIQEAQGIGGEGVERRFEWNKLILHARAIVFADEMPPFEIITLRDVTHIQQLERARRELVSNVTHELSTPITAIGLLADTLLNLAIKEKPKRTRKMAQDIRREVDTLTQLVQEMRDLSLIESGQMPVRLTLTDLLSIIHASVEPMLPLAESKKQTIEVDVPADCYVLVDDLQIQRAIKNIVHNAIKFSPQNEKIYVAATSNADEVIIAIKDNGPGIPSEELPRIFERFYQTDRARRDGTGLGLAIVRHIVLAHGGRTWAESAQRAGATFYIALPSAKDEIFPPAVT